MAIRYTGHPHTVYTTHELNRGAYVQLNSTTDTFGVVKDSKQLLDGRWTSLVRGEPQRPSQQPVARF